MGGQRAKMSVLRAGRCPGILPLLPGHPPFPCLRHIHTHVLWPRHHPQPKPARCVERSSPGTAPHLLFSALLDGHLQYQKACLSSQPRICLSCDLILTRLLRAEHVASEGWELLLVAMGGNSLARESSSSRREQVVNLPEETDAANSVDRANPGVKKAANPPPPPSL